MYKCTWVILATERKRKEQKNPCNNHPTHPRELCVSLNKYSVIPWVLSTPIWGRPDPLTIHPPSTTEIAWGIKAGNGRVIYSDMASKAWALIKGNIVGGS
jgi:hypothetical protein